MWPLPKDPAKLEMLLKLLEDGPCLSETELKQIKEREDKEYMQSIAANT